jgi:hypothetical protein
MVAFPWVKWILAGWTRRQDIIATAETAVDLVKELEKVVHPEDPPNPLPFSEVERIAAQRDAATAFKVVQPVVSMAPSSKPPEPPELLDDDGTLPASAPQPTANRASSPPIANRTPGPPRPPRPPKRKAKPQ